MIKNEFFNLFIFYCWLIINTQSFGALNASKYNSYNISFPFSKFYSGLLNEFTLILNSSVPLYLGPIK